MAIARDDQAGRQTAALQNLCFFNAPHVAMLFMPFFGDNVRAASDWSYGSFLDARLFLRPFPDLNISQLCGFAIFVFNWKDSRQLDDLLAKRPLARCGSLDLISRGWVFPKHDDFVHAVNGQWLTALGAEQKLLPATVIRQVTQEHD